jgi:AraC-like DNA-binding protein
MTKKRAEHEPTMSIRWMWPFANVFGSDPRSLQLLEEVGLTAADLVERDRRIPARVAMHALQRAVEIFGDPTIGLKAGSRLEQSVMDVIDYAACSTENLGTAIGVMSRYSHVMNESGSLTLTIDSDYCYTTYSMSIPHPPQANDLAVSASLTFSKRVCEVYSPPVEIRLQHERPSYADVYQKYFEATVKFGAPANTIVMRKSRLEARMRNRSLPMALAFERKAQELEQAVTRELGISSRVREALAAQLASGSVQMGNTAKRLGMSVATLRRKLEEEGQSFATILDDMRREVAQQYLKRDEPTVSEVAFLLGFSDVRAFARAFRRWTGIAPTEFREQAGRS